MRDRLWRFKLRLGFAVRALRRSKPKPSGADIASVRVALVIAVGCADAMDEAATTARREARQAGGVDSKLDATLALMCATASTIRHCATRDRQRLGLDRLEADR